MKIAKKQVRIIKKIREASGVWRFISLQRAGSRYVWDDRPGYYFLDWREGQKRKREYAGDTPSEATEAQRRKRNELLGALISNGKTALAAKNESLLTIARAKEMFLDHVRAHAPIVNMGDTFDGSALGATRSRNFDCDPLRSPCVLPQVPASLKFHDFESGNAMTVL